MRPCMHAGVRSRASATRLLCIMSSSTSATFDTTIFRKPEGNMCLVLLLVPYPTLGMGAVPLNFRRMRLSMPAWRAAEAAG